MLASLEATPECLCVLTQSMCDRQAVPRTSVSGASVHRPFQARHNVHTCGLCPLKEPEGFRIVFESCINGLGKDSHRHLCLKEDQHA